MINKVGVIIRHLMYLLIIFVIGFLYLGFSDTDFTEKFTIDDKQKSNNLNESEVLISRVVDGDTVIIINANGKEETVRLLLIDSPESVHPTEPEQKFGKEASDFAKNYLKQGQKVVLERGNPEKDKYNRTLGYIFVGNINFNMLMLEKGYARVAYIYESNTRYLSEFKQAESRAKEKKRNIWSIPDYATDKGFDMSVVK